jgi:GTPase involved in cell partitioning and DNA repair
MAKAARAKRGRRARGAGATNVDISVPVPQDTSIKVTDLKNLSDQEINDLIKKAKSAKVGFVIVNAPFKVRPDEPVS